MSLLCEDFSVEHRSDGFREDQSSVESVILPVLRCGCADKRTSAEILARALLVCSAIQYIKATEEGSILLRTC